MPKKTYTQINSITLAASTNSVTFSSIPQNFRDLVLIGDNLRVSSGGENINLYLNSDTNTGNYSLITMFANGSAFRTDGASVIVGYNAYPTSTAATQLVINLMDYSASDKHKLTLCRGNNPGIGVSGSATRWANTAAVNAIRLLAESTSFQVGATFTLYGIEA
jgi:hypothetical protein